jgi:hypothetical protein
VINCAVCLTSSPRPLVLLPFSSSILSIMLVPVWPTMPSQLRREVNVNSTVLSMSTARLLLLMVLLVSIVVSCLLSLVSLSTVVSTSECTTPSSLSFSLEILRVISWLPSCSVGASLLVPVFVPILSTLSVVA